VAAGIVADEHSAETWYDAALGKRRHSIPQFILDGRGQALAIENPCGHVHTLS
jgi:hypothetical protein